MRRHLPLAALVTLSAAGCATLGAPRVGQPGPPGAPRTVEMEPLTIEVGKDGTVAYDAATLFEQAGRELADQRYPDAIRGYDRVTRDFPDSRYALPSYYNAGLALEGQKDYAGAITRYKALIEKHEATKDALDALYRMGACYAELGNWAASADVFARVLERKDVPSVGDQIEARARRGLAQYHMKDSSTAERTFREAIQYYRDHETLERLDSDLFLALCHFYLGEIVHDQFRAIALHLPEKQMKVDLESKATLLLTAQARYVDTARVRNVVWATAAGYQMAKLYKEMYDAIMEAPVPPQLQGEAREVYFEELRKTIEPLLRKAIHAHELTQQVAERNGVDNDWVRKSSEEMEQLRALLAPPAAGQPDQLDGKKGPAAPAPLRDDRLQRPPRPRPDDYHPRVVL